MIAKDMVMEDRDWSAPAPLSSSFALLFFSFFTSTQSHGVLFAKLAVSQRLSFSFPSFTRPLSHALRLCALTSIFGMVCLAAKRRIGGLGRGFVVRLFCNVLQRGMDWVWVMGMEMDFDGDVTWYGHQSPACLAG